MLDTRRLSLLVGVAIHGSISATAAAAGCTPSAASEQLVKLENELGVDLLERSARSVRLTAAGKELAEHGRRILTELDAAQRSTEEVAGLSGGRLRLAAYYSGMTRFVIPALGTFSRRHPGVQVMFDEMEPEVALPAVRDGAVDVAVVHRYVGLQAPDMAGIDSTVLMTDPFVLAVPDRYAAAGHKPSLSSFADVPWVSLRPSEGFQAVTELAAAREGFVPNIVARADYYTLIVEMVAAGLGVALIPSAVMQPRRTVRIYPVEGHRRLARQEAVVSRSADRSRGAAELIDLIVKRA